MQALLLRRKLEQRLVDDVADVLEVGREQDEVEGAARLLLRERVAGQAREVKLDLLLEAVDRVVEALHRLAPLLAVVAEGEDGLAQHDLDHVGKPHDLARGAAERERRTLEKILVEMLDRRPARRLRLRDEALEEPRREPRERQEHE